MLLIIIAGPFLIIALSLHVAHVPVRHRWRRRQARSMREQLRGPHEHVQSFAGLCARQRQPTLFIHADRTGAMSRVALTGAPDVVIISGDHLIALLMGRSLSIAEWLI